ncbi:ABC transporter substrate-binding protein [Verrucosispora sp. WMMA2044]|uniref:ABC transporter substrate-binding protein n=1 Tax=Verrucosispora sioxanthis TaxID=2499994 RepID=A0A6M1L9Q6_9ACTN|nr:MULTISPECIES: ABC transporter substrate-binding protein [Micromonospora]NEE65839.1 ABC transporter substrate-binding protein [Verrucosispora sioxanthis]NGM14949.1 ABC transporter substrate-binding protein [Verrucosispora sioxanthis]WBB48358.1 ABC transporter substrate-binding protein [Verrucosispora sp. WMMA2044]
MSQMNRRRALQLLAAIGTSGLVAGCGSDAEPEVTSSASPVKIGLIAPQSGAGKAIGDELTNGFELYLDLNDRQLGGHPVDLITADEGDNVKSGQAAVEGLLKQGVLALTGVASSAVMFGIRDIVEQARVPLIGSNASPPSLQSVVYIWRTSYVLDEAGRALGRYLKDELTAADRIATILPEGVLGVEDVLRGFREEFGESDPRIASPVVWTSGDSSPSRTAYVSDINRALAGNPSVVFCFYSGTAAVEFIMQLRDAGFRGRIYAPGFLTEGSVLEDIRPTSDALGIRTALNYSADLNNAANRRFASAYRKKHNTSPTTYAMASYDAAKVLDQAIRLAGEAPSPQQVNLALGRIGQIDSPRGAWQFNQPRTPQQKWYLREVQRDGQVVSNVLVNELATLG